VGGTTRDNATGDQLTWNYRHFIAVTGHINYS